MAYQVHGAFKECQRAVSRFFMAEGITPAGIYRRVVRYMRASMSQQRVYEWVTRFRVGRTSLEDNTLLGQAHHVITDRQGG